MGKIIHFFVLVIVLSVPQISHSAEIPNKRFSHTDGYTYFITLKSYASLSNYKVSIQSDYGSNAELVDWNTLEAEFSGQIASFMTAIGICAGDTEGILVQKGGDTTYSSTRGYFITRFDGNVPSYYLVHNNIDSRTVVLGSWKTTRRALVRIPSASILISSSAILNPVLSLLLTDSKNEEIVSYAETSNAYFFPDVRHVDQDAGLLSSIATFLISHAVDKFLGDFLSALAGRTASNIFGFVGSVLDQVPSVGGALNTDIFLVEEVTGNIIDSRNQSTFSYTWMNRTGTHYLPICYVSLGSDTSKRPYGIYLKSLANSNDIVTIDIEWPRNVRPTNYLIVPKQSFHDLPGSFNLVGVEISCGADGGLLDPSTINTIGLNVH